jgi:hypothetical protein
MYYNARVALGTPNEDSGATIKDAIKTAAQYGAPKAELWPYIPSKFTQKPPASVYDVADDFQIVTYAKLNNRYLNQLKAC